MKGMQFLIEPSFDDHYSIRRCSAGANGKQPQWITSGSLCWRVSEAFDRVYKMIVAPAKTIDERMAICRKIKRIKIVVLFED